MYSINKNNDTKMRNIKKNNSLIKEYLNNTNIEFSKYKHSIYKSIKYKELEDKYMIKSIKKGKSYSFVKLIQNKNKKYVLKYNKINNRFKNEILINIDISINIRSTISPKIIQYGYLTKGIFKYYYYIQEYIDGYLIKDLYQSNIIKNIVTLKKLYVNLIRKYIKINKKTGFMHLDIKSDNIIYSKKTNSLKLIDFGLSLSKKHKYSLSTKLIKNIENPFKKYIYPIKNIERTSFNYSIMNVTFIKNKAYKSLNQLDLSIIDLTNLIKLYNTGIRYLFSKHSQIIISSKQARVLNSDRYSFYKKLKYIIKMIQNN